MKTKSIAREFAVLFILFALITMIVSGVMTFVNQTESYHEECIENLHEMTGHLNRLIANEGSEFNDLKNWYDQNPDKVLIPIEFREDLPASKAAFYQYTREHYDGMSPGKGIEFDDLDDEGKRLYVKYRFEYWFTVFFDAADQFKLSYVYFIYPSDESKYLMNYMFDPSLDTFKGPDGNEYLKLERDVYEDPELHKYMWEAWKTGEAPEWIDSIDNEYGFVYTYCRPVYYEGVKTGLICADISIERVSKAILTSVLRQMVIMIVVFAIVLTILYAYLRKKVFNRIITLKEEVHKYSDDKDPAIADEIMARKGKMDEIGTLYERFAEMIGSLDVYMKDLQHVTAEKERIGAELNIATKIQEDMLPRLFPAFPELTQFDIYATMDPAKEVGGDFYDFFMIDDKHFAVVIADVSGKGVPAALFMVIAKTLIKNRLLTGESPAEALHNVNNQLCEGNDTGFFVTVWLAVIDITTGKGLAANAGHENPAIRRKDGSYEMIRTRHSPAVAALDGMVFRENEFKLDPGDSFFVYTDGVTEATDKDNNMFGEGRLTEVLNNNADADPEVLLPAVKSAIDEFVGDAPQFDDITMVGFRFNGAAD